MGAGQENLRPPVFPADVQDQRANPVVDTQHLARNLRVASQHPFGPAEVDDDMAELNPLDDTGDDLALPILIFFELALALGIANLLHNDLLGGLGCNPAKFDRR